jgi:hypothetical protein
MIVPAHVILRIHVWGLVGGPALRAHPFASLTVAYHSLSVARRTPYVNTKTGIAMRILAVVH